MTNPLLGSISPSASLLDPMGYTQTSFLDPSPVSSTPRPAALLGTYASAFNDAGGFISFARSSPAQAPWDPLGVTSQAADDGDPSYDPRLLSLITPETAGDGDVDPVPAYYQRQQAEEAVQTPEAGDRRPIFPPAKAASIIIRDATAIRRDRGQWQRTGSTLNLVVQAGKHTEVSVKTARGNQLTFNIGLNTSGHLSVPFSSADAPGTFVWVTQGAGPFAVIDLPSIQEENAFRWAQKISHLSYLLPKKSWSSPEGSSLLQHYRVYSAGATILKDRELPRIVANGSSYSRQTFFGALGRLAMAVNFQHIANLIEREANGRYSSLADLVVTDDIKLVSPSFLGSSHNLTVGTAALAGFIYNHDEVTGHHPLAIIGANGKWLRQNYDFSLHVRRALVFWGNALTIFPRYTGNFKAHVQASVRKVAELTNHHHFFDGKDDPWSGSAIYEPTHPRGRELREDRKQTPKYPFEGRRSSENNLRLADILLQINRNDIPEIVDRVHRAFLADNPTDFGQLHRLQIEVEARQEARRVLVPLIMRLITIPGVVVGQDLEDPISEELINRVLDGPGPAPSGPNLRAVLEDALRNYIASPWEPNRRAALDTAFHHFMRRADEAFDFRGTIGLVGADFRIIVNTLIMGGDELYGAALEGNPYGQYTRVYNLFADAQALGGVTMDVRATIARYATRHVPVASRPEL